MEDDHNVINYLKPNNLQRGKKMFFSANSIPLDVHLVNPNSIWPHNGSTKKLNSEIECISCTTSRGKNSKSVQRIKMKEVGKRNKKKSANLNIMCNYRERDRQNKNNAKNKKGTYINIKNNNLSSTNRIFTHMQEQNISLHVI